MRATDSIKIVLSCLVALIAVFVTSRVCEAKYKGKGFFIPQIVSAPVQKGVALEVPSQPDNQELAQIGLVDVTSAPFLADQTGITDSTRAIQQAINFARDHQMVAFFPSGVYTVSDTISCIQEYYNVGKKKVFWARKHPCVLLGSRSGPRPKITLRPNSPGFHNVSKRKYLIHFWARLKGKLVKSSDDPTISMNQMLINIDVSIGEGNPGAVAIRHRGAEGSGVQECEIDATHGHTGLEGGVGSGGSHAGITIIGGRIGLDLLESQPAPTICGITLIGQTERAIIYGGRQSLAAVGIKIVSNAAIIIEGRPRYSAPHWGQIAMVDSQIIAENPHAVAITSKGSLYLKNVYVHGGRWAIKNPRGPFIKAKAGNWLRIDEFASGVDPKHWKGVQFTAPIYVDGKKRRDAIIDFSPGVSPPSDLQSRHLWNSKNFPGFESNRAVNVKLPPYGAKGDGLADDSGPIQRAINENEIVFLPKGYYRLTKSLTLRPHTKLIGVAKHLSILLNTGAEGDFADTSLPQPLIFSSSDTMGKATLAFLEILVPRQKTGSYALKWQTGRHSMIRDVNFRHSLLRQDGGRKKISYMKDFPLVLITGNGGGKWYNFNIDNRRNQGDKYRHLKIHGTSEPLSFYQLCLQHTMGRANLEISNSMFISIYGQKGESPGYQMLVNKSDNINLFGYGGNAAAPPNKALFLIRNTPNFIFANLVDTPITWKNKDLRYPWHMLSEWGDSKQLCRTAPLERPVIYQRGHPVRFPDKPCDRDENGR